MKKEHVRIINVGAIGIILGVVIATVIVLIFSPDSAQSETEPQAETQTETQTDIQPEVEESSITELTDAEFFKAMPDDGKARLIAIICLATEQGNSSKDIAATIAESFDAISEDYADSLVFATIRTVCPDASE